MAQVQRKRRRNSIPTTRCSHEGFREQIVSAILLAYELDGKGGGQPLEENAISEAVSGHRFTWLHMDVNHEETRDWLKNKIQGLDPFIIEALLGFLIS